MASLTFDGVTKRYDGGVTAVDDLSLHIDDGEFMVLLGPSGCGKSTALRMIAGFEEITEGTLSIGDRVVNHVEPAKREVSMVFQSYALYPHMTVARNIESPLLVRKFRADGPDQPARKLTKPERAERVTDAARKLELTPYLDRKPRALSGGQRQRVALARAVVGDPQVYLLDEPLSNLDAKLRAQTRRELVDLHRRVATTTVYVTHDQVEALTMATRIAIMSAGQLQQVGTPAEVYDAPANLIVAGFIGTPPMNCLPGTFTTDGSAAVMVGSSRFPIPPTLNTRLEDGASVVVGVRPEHLVVAELGAIAAEVSAVEWLGHELLVFADVAGNPITGRQSGLGAVPPEGAVSFSVEPQHIRLFDPVTTLAIT